MIKWETLTRQLFWMECDVSGCKNRSPETTWASGVARVAVLAGWQGREPSGNPHYCPSCWAQMQEGC